MKAYKQYITRISVIGTNDKIFYEGNPRITGKDILNDPSIKKIIAADGSKLWIKQNDDGVLWDETITLGRVIKYERQPIGVVMIDMDYDVIKKTYSFGSLIDSNIFVVETDGNFVYNSNAAMQEHNIGDTSYASVYRSLGNTDPMIRIDGKPHLVVHYTSPYTGWTTIGVIPESTLLRDSVPLRHLIVQILLIVIVVVFIVSYHVAKHITKNMRKLQKSMQWIKEGNLTIVSTVKSEDEIGELSQVFEDMIGRLRMLMSDIQAGELQKREAELAALQAQITPHFLYNTLNTIKYLARLRNVPNIEEVTISLITLLRGVVGNTKPQITIREELEYAKSYITIQKYKYIEPFDVRWQIDEELLDCRIHKLILQPVIENAIIHGIGPLKEGGKLDVSLVKVGEQALKLIVTDNGLGMSLNQIERILQKKSASDRQGFSGMGIMNVHERITMLYGDTYGVSISSEPGIFTRVEIKIPATKEET